MPTTTEAIEPTDNATAIKLRAGCCRGEIGLLVLLGVLLHIPVAALFVVPYLKQRSASA